MKPISDDLSSRQRTKSEVNKIDCDLKVEIFGESASTCIDLGQYESDVVSQSDLPFFHGLHRSGPQLKVSYILRKERRYWIASEA